MEPVVELRGVTCRSASGKAVFEQADLQLYPGTRVLVTGPVASGYGLLVRLISGLAQPDEGVIKVFGTPLTGASKDEMVQARTRMGVILGDGALISNLKVIENVALPLMYHTSVASGAALGRAVELLDDVGYNLDKWSLPGPLPAYFQKLVVIARALAMEPPVVIYEGVSAIFSTFEKESIARVLTSYQKAAATERMLLVASSRERDAELIEADRVVRIVDGKFEG